LLPFGSLNHRLRQSNSHVHSSKAMGVSRKTRETNIWEVKGSAKMGKASSSKPEAPMQKIEEDKLMLLPPGLDVPPSVVAAVVAESEAEAKQAARDADDSPPGARPPPGLEDADLRAVDITVCHVFIHGLPKKLLSAAMMEAVIDQADLGAEVTAFTFQKSRREQGSREVVIGFACLQAAEQCVKHFDGCQFGTSGNSSGVTCRMVLAEEVAEKASDSAHESVQCWAACDYAVDTNKEGLDKFISDYKLSAQAAVFVPSNLCNFVADCKDMSANRKISDASTDVGSEWSEQADALDFGWDMTAVPAC